MASLMWFFLMNLKTV